MRYNSSASKVYKKRKQGALKRIGRITALKKVSTAAYKVGAMGLKPALLYGAAVHGVAPTRRSFLRAQVGLTTFGSTRGRSFTLTFAVHSEVKDPSLDATRVPLVLWRKMHRREAVPEQALDTTLMKAWKSLHRKKSS